MKSVAVLIGFAFVLAVLSKEHCSTSVCKVNEDELKFFLLGDTGGFPVLPYSTEGQRKENWDKVYTKTPYMYKPWHVIAGNHDHYGNASVQVDYTTRNDRWSFPSLYYKFAYEFNNTTADFIMLDTVMLCGNVLDHELLGDDIPLNERQPKGPERVVDAEEQWKWLEQQLAASKADYLIVAGHYPVYSVSYHGPTQCLVDRLEPLLHKYKVSAYLSGHDHDIQQLKYIDLDWEVTYIVSGAGSRLDFDTDHKDKVPDHSLIYLYPDLKMQQENAENRIDHFYLGAFVMMNLGKDGGHMEVFNEAGKQEYVSRPFNKRH